MSIYDRPYMRAGYQPRSLQRPWFWWVVGSLAVAYALQRLLAVWLGVGGWREAIALTESGLLSGFVWTLLSYGWLHGGLFHLLVNCLFLFFLGRALLPEMGHVRLTQLFCLAVATGGLAWAVLHVPFGAPSMLVGASGGLSGIFVAYCLRNWGRSITLMLFFVLPLTLSTQLALWLFLGFDTLGLLFDELPSQFQQVVGQTSGIGHSAHLGGALAGWLWVRADQRGWNILRWRKRKTQPGVTVEGPSWAQRARQAAGAFKVNVKQSGPSREEVDRILDKINQKGFGALSEQERQTLDKARDQMRG